MTELGFALLLTGAVLVVAEVHVSGGVLGVAGGVALMVGGIVAIAALGGGAAIAVPVGFALGAVAAAWALINTRAVSRTRRIPVRAGSEALCGRVGEVRRWSDSAGAVFVDGALWRARHQALRDDDEGALHEGDAIVVEHVSGLTLSVRRAEEWELPA